MVTRTQPRRRIRAVAAVHRPKPTLITSLTRAATSRPAQAIYVVMGAAGLTALTVALVGPKRIEKEVIRPLRDAIEPQAEKLWADSRQLRDQIASLFSRATPTNRERLVRSFQSWIGHFHAT
jgi:hypothetical protein